MQGLGAGAMMTCVYTAISLSYPDELRAKILGAFGTVLCSSVHARSIRCRSYRRSVVLAVCFLGNITDPDNFSAA